MDLASNVNAMRACHVAVFTMPHVWIILLLLITSRCAGETTKESAQDDREIVRLQRLYGGQTWVQKQNRVFPQLDKEACGKASLSKESMNRKRWDLEPPITSYKNLTHPGTRVLLVYPRMGLGNTLRGFKSAYAYSLFSGRRLVLVSSGPHRKGLDVLCEAFNCPDDYIIDEKMDDGGAYKQIYHPIVVTSGPEIRLLQYLDSNDPVLTVHSGGTFNKYWRTDPILEECLFKTLNCSTEFCVHSRAMKYLLGRGPKKILEDTIEEVLQGSSENRVVASIESNKSLQLSFDLAIHIRTYTASVEGVEISKDCQVKNTCSSELQRINLREEKTRKTYIGSKFWRCFRTYHKKLQDLLATKDDSQPTMNIFLATDHETLRPIFVKKLSEYGVIYYSSGSVIHTSRGKGGSPMATMSEFLLLSTARYMLSYSRKISTFARAATEYGNVTISTFRHHHKNCTIYMDSRTQEEP